MSSSINPYNINGNFPVAGQDNDSQGFRDNFTNTKNNLAFAKAEIEDLQSKVVLKSALSGGLLNNDMSGAVMTSPQLKAWTQTIVTQSGVNGTVSLNYAYGNFQQVVPNGAVTLSIAGWPALTGTGSVGHGVMRIWLSIINTAYTVTLPSSVNVGVSDLAGYNSATRTITFDTTGEYVFDLTSTDGGTTYALLDLSRNLTKIRGNLTLTGTTIDNGYQYAQPATGTTVTVTAGKSRLVMGPLATLATLTVTLPNGSGLADGTIIPISSNAQVTSLTVNSASGTVTPSTAFQLNAGSGVQYMWRASETKWYKIA